MKSPAFGRCVSMVVGFSLMLGLAVTGCRDPDNSSETAVRSARYYHCSMHPWIRADQPGSCPICGMDLTPIYEGGGAETHDHLIALSESSVHALNVQTVTVKTQALTKTLMVAGTLELDETRRRVMAAYVGGRIEQLHFGFVGAEVTAGQPLAGIYSPALLQAEREYRMAPAELRPAVASRLRQLGLTGAQIQALPAKDPDQLTSEILAPISGTVMTKAVLAGQYVTEGARLFEIADLSRLWFQFQVYEADLPWVCTGQTITVSTPAHPGQTIAGTISFLEPDLDPVTRTLRARVELDNPRVNGRRRFAYRSYAEGRVELTAPVVLAAPRSAILQTGPEAVVFVDEGGGGYSRRTVQLGRRGDTLVEILGGLSAGEAVVVSGQLLMDGQMEINRPPPTAGHSAAPEASPAWPALDAAQRQAVTDYLALADALAAALAADEVKQFNLHAERAPAVTTQLLAAFDRPSPWQALARAALNTGHLTAAATLETARKTFYPFSEAAVALAQAARRKETAFAGVKVFRCPMTKDAFPGAPNRAEWLQLQPGVRNPWFGAEMLDCGAEVKP